MTLLLLLLLLHLLQINEGHAGVGRLLGLLDKHAPVLGDGQLAVQSRWLIAGCYVHSDV